MDISTLLAAIEDARQCGVCHLAVYNKQIDTTWESIVARHFKATTASANWLIAISSSQANAILTKLLAEDMAYEAELMPLEEARKLAGTFLALFSNQSLFLSNSSWSADKVAALADDFEPKLSAWSSFTKATFDSGIIICDSSKVGIAWFEDED